MGVSPPSPQGSDPRAGAGWAETPVDVLLDHAEHALSGGDLPRARTLLNNLLAKPLAVREAVDCWELALRIEVEAGDHAAADRAVVELARRIPIGDIRQRIRKLWLGRPPNVAWENELLDRAEEACAANAPASAASAVAAREPDSAAGDDDDGEAPGPAVLQLLDALRRDDGDEDEDVGVPDPDAARLFYDDRPYPPEMLRTPVEAEDVQALLAEDGGGDVLPLLDGTELVGRSPGEIHRVVAEHPGASGRELLRRYAAEQARLTTPDELQHSYDMGLELFGQEQFEEAAHLLLPVAMLPNPERLGALELLARALFALDRLPQAEAYLKEAVPSGRRVTEPAYAPLFYWLGMIAEERGDPGMALDYYTTAVKLQPDIVEAKRRLRAILAL